MNGGNALYRYSGVTWPVDGLPGTTTKKLSDIISQYSGVRIRVSDPWLGIRVGEPYADGYTENIDKFVFATENQETIFDFEQNVIETNKVWICHAPRTDKFLALNIDANGAENGHGGGQGTHSDDIVPPFDDFPGLNWTVENQTYWEENCNGAVLGDSCEVGPAYAFSVKDSIQGKMKNGSDVLSVRSDPNSSLGAPDALFYSLGFGGWVEVKFNGYIVDGVGDDITFSEVTNGTYPQELANVEVSKDGVTWVTAGTVNNTGDNGVDISGTSLDWVKYVRVTDTSNSALFENTADGYDLNSVGANVICTQPVPEEPIEPCEVVAISDNTNTVTEKAGAFAKQLSWTHPAWTANIPGATWIWGDDPVADPTNETTQTFVKTFYWNGPVTSAVLDIAADNDYEVRINGDLVGSDYSGNTYALADNYDIASFIDSNALNTIEIKVTNWEWPTVSAQTNPAGLLYKAVVTGTDKDCGQFPEEPPVPAVTLSAQKIICDNEELLPNAGDRSLQPIGSTTAEDWVANRPGCSIAKGWSFEYKTEGDQSNPGGSTIGPKGGNWNTFTAGVNDSIATKSVPIDDINLIQTREVLPEGYIPFSDSSNNVSAEFYCHNDAGNYDNWEWIQGLQDDATYHCVAWNVEVVPEPTTAVLNVQKVECVTEDLLPDFGYGADETIDANTAQNWVNQSEGGCKLVPWNFQWQADPSTNPGNQVGEAEGWTTFNTSVEISTENTSTIWVREVFNDSYKPFAGQTTEKSVSAEIYCHTDVLHYDNWERIDNIQSGNTYYCVAWNVLEPIGRIQGVIYEDENGNGSQQPKEPFLEGWSATLLTRNSPFKVAGIDTTGLDGEFLFEDLAFGTYYVCQDLKSGWLQTEKGADGSGIPVISLAVGDFIPGDDADVEALVAKYCYEVVLTSDNPTSDENYFGNNRSNPGGRTLGDFDIKEDPNEDTTGGQGSGGSVLADTDTLATTGQASYTNVILGSLLIGLTAILMFARRKATATISKR